jgi:hypothetical protein
MAEDTKISPEGRVCSPVRKAEGDSNPALSRLGAGERLFGADRAHIERMLDFVRRAQKLQQAFDEILIAEKARRKGR